MTNKQNLDHLETLAFELRSAARQLRQYLKLAAGTAHWTDSKQSSACDEAAGIIEALAHHTTPVSAPIAGDALTDEQIVQVFNRVQGRWSNFGGPLNAVVKFGREIAALANQSEPTDKPEPVKKHYHELAPGDIVVAINGVKLDRPEYVVQGGGNDYLIFKSGYTGYGISDSFTVDAAFANQQAPTAASEQVAQDEKALFATALREYDRRADDGIIGLRWDRAEGHVWRAARALSQPSEAAPLDNAKAGIEQAYKACQQVSTSFDPHSGERHGARLCIAAVKALYLAAPSMPAAAPAAGTKETSR